MPHAAVVKPLFSSPTRFAGGVTTHSRENAKGKLGFPDITQYHVFFDDFDNLLLSTTNWAAAQGTGSPVLGNAAGDGGTATLVTTTGTSDSVDLTRHATKGPSFTFDTARKFYMETRLMVDSATLGELAFGMVPASTTTEAASMTDGFRIAKTSAVGTFDFKSFVGSATAASTTATLWNSAAMPLSTMITLGMAYTGVTQLVAGVVNYEFVVYVDLNDGNGQRQQSILLPATTFPANTVKLMPCISYVNTTGVARLVTVDYVFVAKERFNA